MKFNFRMIHILVILLLSLALCSFLGGNCNVEGLENRSPYVNQPKSTSDPTNETTYNEKQVVEDINPIQKKDIPSGSEDLYILRSEVSNLLQKPSCPPCQPCARCPEPSFECKKVPNYGKLNNGYLPKPVLSDFSTFSG